MIDTIAVKAVDQNAEVLTGLAKKIWDNPETAFNEVKACQWTAEVLKNAGLKWKSVMWVCPLPSGPHGGRAIR